MSIDLRFLALALRLGDQQAARTLGNPAVGAVVVKDGRVLGRGATADNGRPHGEPIALAQAGKAAKGADLYVSLEPCVHHGKSPPCTDAIIKAGIARVICPFRDPDPRVAGGGFAKLRDHGIACIHPKLDEIPQGLEGFFMRKTQDRPFVTLKLASSLDGKIALANGESQWISGAQTRRATRILRSQFQAILVGINTVLADDPALTIREAGLDGFAPQPVILDSAARTPSRAKIFDHPKAPLLFHDESVTPDYSPKHGEWMGVARQESGLDIRAILSALAAREINSLLIEGGAQVATSFLRAGVVDRIVHVSTGAVMGADAQNAIAALGLMQMQDVPRFSLSRAQIIGDDALLTYTRRALDPREFLAG